MENVASGPLAHGTGAPFDVALAEGDAAYAADRLPQARRAYERARALAPQEPAPPVGLARVKLAESGLPLEFAAAPGNSVLLALARELDGFITRHPEFLPARLERGRVALLLGDASVALPALGAVARAAPRDAEALSALAVAELATGDPKAAEQHFRRAAELEAEVPERWLNHGTAQLLIGDVAGAVRTFERAARLAPSDPRAVGNLGTAHLAAGRPDLALPHLERAVMLAPDRATFLNNLGYAQQLQGQVDRAVATYQRALGLDPKLASAWLNLGTAQAARGELDAAERSFRQALALDPSDPRAKANLADLADLADLAHQRRGGPSTAPRRE